MNAVTKHESASWVQFVPLVYWLYTWVRYKAISLSLVLYVAAVTAAALHLGLIPTVIFAALLLFPMAVLVGFEMLFGRVKGPALCAFLITWVLASQGITSVETARATAISLLQQAVYGEGLFKRS